VNNYDVIAVEDLNTSGMVRVKGNLAEKILDASWIA
jgi:transposase